MRTSMRTTALANAYLPNTAVAVGFEEGLEIVLCAAGFGKDGCRVNGFAG